MIDPWSGTIRGCPSLDALPVKVISRLLILPRAQTGLKVTVAKRRAWVGADRKIIQRYSSILSEVHSGGLESNLYREAMSHKDGILYERLVFLPYGHVKA